MNDWNFFSSKSNFVVLSAHGTKLPFFQNHLTLCAVIIAVECFFKNVIIRGLFHGLKCSRKVKILLCLETKLCQNDVTDVFAVR